MNHETVYIIQDHKKGGTESAFNAVTKTWGDQGYELVTVTPLLVAGQTVGYWMFFIQSFMEVITDGET